MDPEEKKVIFETDNFMPQQMARPKFIAGIPHLVIKYSGGYIKDEKQANYVLLGFIVLAIVISLFLIFNGGEIASPPEDIKILPAVL